MKILKHWVFYQQLKILILHLHLQKMLFLKLKLKINKDGPKKTMVLLIYKEI